MSYSSPRKERPSDILFGSRDTINSPTISIRPATVQFNFFRTSLVFFPAENTAEPIQSTKSRLLRSNEGFIFRTSDSVSNQPVDCTSTYIDNLISHGQASTDAIDSRMIADFKYISLCLSPNCIKNDRNPYYSSVNYKT